MTGVYHLGEKISFGTARMIAGARDLNDFRPGEVLVAGGGYSRGGVRRTQYNASPPHAFEKIELPAHLLHGQGEAA